MLARLPEMNRVKFGFWLVASARRETRERLARAMSAHLIQAPGAGAIAKGVALAAPRHFRGGGGNGD